ncbi:hypothetical protein R3P38DRAFT_2869180 [Favolaschia claudopus]|uniref:Uncharacterized protein n=1 Tax=Favolaschia claudopus TaxID=2862362 RepID=A0AAW0DA52_9AGAR
MTSLRHRVGFTASDDDGDAQNHVLDDVEQEEVIEDLRQRNDETTARATLVLDVVLPSLRALPSFIPTLEPDPPCPILFTLLALGLHSNLTLLVHPTLALHSTLKALPLPISFSLTYALAAVWPTLSLFLARSWQVTAFSAASFLVVALTHSVLRTLQEGDQALAELETLRYRAPGP